jgi:tripartite ATP-independent transporter DctP family solute receptor
MEQLMKATARARLLPIAIALALFSALVPRSVLAEELVVKMATVAPDNTPWSELLKSYKKSVEEKSGGRIKVKVFLGGALGDENETLLKCKRGQVQGVATTTGAAASQIPELNVLELPYLFRDAAEADHVIDTVLTKPLEGTLRKYGFVLGLWSENGFRQFGTGDGFVTSPEALKGKKMRSQESSVHLEMWKAFGASPVPVPTTEVLTALQTHTVDGYDQSILFAVAAGWYKAVKYFTVSNHIYQPALVVFNQEWFDKVPADLQKILLDEGRALQTKGRKAVRAIQPDLIKGMKQGGVEVVELTPAQRDVFEKAAAPVRKWFRKSQGKEASKLLDAVEKGIGEYRKSPH